MIATATKPTTAPPPAKETLPGRRTLYQITDDLMAIDDLLMESGGDISDPKVGETVDAWMTELNTNLESKADNYAALIVEMEKRAETRKAEAERMARLAVQDAGSAAWLKTKLKSALELLGIDRIDGARFRISVAGNGGKAPLDIHDPNAVPRKLCKHVPETWEPDGDLIREAMAKGQDVPGAILQVRGKHLRIK